MKLRKLTPLLAALIVASSQSAFAATFTVTNTADTAPGACDSDCTLREAIIAANGNDASTNLIVLPAGTYTLAIAGIDEDAAATGDIDITKSLTISGAGADVTTVNAAGIDRVFHVLSTSNADVTFNDLTITGGKGVVLGGGISYEALNRTLKINRCNITGNETPTNVISAGGGLFVSGDVTFPSMVVVSNSSISNNLAGVGGGFALLNGLGAIVNSTVSENQSAFGGGLFIDDGSSQAVLTIASSTITANDTTLGDNLTGGGIAIGGNGGQITIGNSIVGGNLSDDGIDCVAGVGIINSVGSNLFNSTMGNSTCTPIFFGDKLFEGLVLPPLADNGGPTPTNAILAGSPAIDGGSADDCQNELFDFINLNIGEEVFSSDQRGQDRVINGRCDIGAFEFGAAADVSILKNANVSETGEGNEVTYTLNVKNEGPNKALDVVVTDDLPAGLTFVSASSPCTEAAGTVTCNLGTLDGGETAVINIIASTDDIADNSGAVVITNTATVASSEDTLADNNSSSADIVVSDQFNGAISGDGGCSLNPAAVNGGSLASVLAFVGLGLAGWVRSRKNI